MANRRCLYINESDSNHLKEFSNAEMTALATEAIEQYGGASTVNLTQVSSSGTLDSLNDTRLQAGAGTTDAVNFDLVGETPDVSTVTVSYDRITETIVQETAPVNSNSRAYSLYYRNYDGSGATGNIHAMTTTDMLDTIIYGAIDRLVEAEVTSDQAGGFHINTANSGVSGSTLVSATPVYIDTRADAAAYTAAGISETQDQPTTITSYYLWKIDATAGTYQAPCYADASGNINEFTAANYSAILLNLTQYIASHSGNSYAIRYNVGGSGNNRGSGMVDTKLNSSSYNTLQVNTNDYRAQEFPAGTAATIATVYLKVAKTALTTTLNGAITDAAATTIALANTYGMPNAGTMLVGSEKFTYTGLSTNTGNGNATGCTRGALSTTAATHSDGATVTLQELTD